MAKEEQISRSIKYQKSKENEGYQDVDLFENNTNDCNQIATYCIQL